MGVTNCSNWKEQINWLATLKHHHPKGDLNMPHFKHTKQVFSRILLELNSGTQAYDRRPILLYLYAQLTSRRSRPRPWPPVPHRSQWRSSPHSGSTFWLCVVCQTRSPDNLSKLIKRENGGNVTMYSHSVSCFAAMLISQKETRRARLWWWRQERSKIPVVEVLNQHRSGFENVVKYPWQQVKSASGGIFQNHGHKLRQKKQKQLTVDSSIDSVHNTVWRTG